MADRDPDRPHREESPKTAAPLLILVIFLALIIVAMALVTVLL